MHREGEVQRVSQGKMCCPETIFLERFDKIIKILKKPKKSLHSDIYTVGLQCRLAVDSSNVSGLRAKNCRNKIQQS